MKLDDLKFTLSNLSPEEWREILLSVADQRCIACGSDHACDCNDAVDEAKLLVASRVATLQSSGGQE